MNNMKFEEMADRLKKYLEARGRPAPVPCSPALRQQWETSIYPLMRDQCLSDLRRNDETRPRLTLVDLNGELRAIDVMNAAQSSVFDVAARNHVSRTHQVTACIPGVRMSVFTVETWMLSASVDDKERMRIMTSGESIHDHPDREEAVMAIMLSCDQDRWEMSQIHSLAPIIKVLGQNRSRQAIRDTTLGEPMHSDPMGQGHYAKLKGRFVYDNED